MTFPILTLDKITVKALSKETPIIKDLSLNVYPGDFIVLLGSNGSGKSTLLKVINGLITPTEGTLLLRGENLLAQSVHKRAKSIATVVQDVMSSTFSNLSVLENCQIALHRHKTPIFSLKRSQEKQLIASRLQIFHPTLSQKLEQKTGSLSGGEKQALALAMALWMTPSLLLLDEHTSALDPMIATELMKLTHHLATEQKIPTIVTTHRIEDALCYGNRVIALKNGNIILDRANKDKQSLTKEEIFSIYAV